jgi:hypothetical protein
MINDQCAMTKRSIDRPIDQLTDRQFTNHQVCHV